MSLTHRSVASVTVLLLVALGLPLIADTPAEAQTVLRVAPSDPVHKEYIFIRGRVSTQNARPVRLQFYKSGVGWRVLAKAKSGSAGYFRFRTRAIGPERVYRVVAPRAGGNAREVTRARRVRTVTPRASIRLVPAPIGQAKNTTTRYLTPVNMAFKPARRGRVVKLQRYSSGAWRTIDSGVQNRRGYATFNINTKYARNYYHRAVAVTHNGASYVVSKGYYARTKQLRFRDDFSGTALDLNRWAYRQVGSRNPAGMRACSESSRSAVSVASGSLRLDVRKIQPTSLDYDVTADCPYGQFYNGHIGTQGRFGTTYGIMAARMRLAPGMGKHSAFWTRPAAGGDAEIDIMEYFGRRNNIQHKVYWDGGSHGRVFDLSRVLGKDKTYTNSYHVFSVEWTKSVYIFRVDGIETFRTRRGRSHVDQFLIASLLSSDYELPYLNQSTLPHTTYVDWVRVWR